MKEKKVKKTIKVILKGDFYSSDTYCYTLKEFMELHHLKRSNIKEWYR